MLYTKTIIHLIIGYKLRTKMYWIWIILVPYFESTNSSLLTKCALWNLDLKCLPFTSIAALFYNYWNSICGTVGANKSFQSFMDLGRRSSLNMTHTKKNQQQIILYKKVDTDALFKLTVLTPYYFIVVWYFFLISFSPVIISQFIFLYSVNVYVKMLFCSIILNVII